MKSDDVFDISKAYSDDEMKRVFLQVQLKEITLCETCDVFFKYVPQKDSVTLVILNVAKRLLNAETKKSERVLNCGQKSKAKA